MNSIIITSIICVSLIIIVCLICYSNWRNRNGDELKFIYKCIDRINDKINKQYDVTDKYMDDIKEHLRKLNEFLAMIKR